MFDGILVVKTFSESYMYSNTCAIHVLHSYEASSKLVFALLLWRCYVIACVVLVNN